MLRSDLCDYNGAYIFVKVKGIITVEGTNDANKRDKNLSFKNNAKFRSSISKINNTLIENAEDLDTVMLMNNFLEFSDNYFMTSGSLSNYYRDEVNDNANEVNGDNYRLDYNKAITSQSFEYKTKMTGSTSGDNSTLDTKVVLPLKYWNNFCRSINLHLNNCRIELDLSWSNNRVISEISKTPAVAANPLNPAKDTTKTTSATFEITGAKRFVPVVTFIIFRKHKARI